jgi:hypothetical protein
MTSAISLQELRRPLRHQEQCLFRGADKSRDSLDALGRLLEQGDEQAEAVAEAMAYALIYGAMTRRLLDRNRGALPEFVGRLRKAVDSFEANIR